MRAKQLGTLIRQRELNLLFQVLHRYAYGDKLTQESEQLQHRLRELVKSILKK